MNKKALSKKAIRTLGSYTTSALGVKTAEDIGYYESNGKVPPSPVTPENPKPENADFKSPTVQTQPQATTPEQQPDPDMGGESHKESIPTEAVQQSSSFGQTDAGKPPKMAKSKKKSQSIPTKPVQERANLGQNGADESMSHAISSESIPTKPAITQPNLHSPESLKIPSEVENQMVPQSESIPTESAVAQPNKGTPEANKISPSDHNMGQGDQKQFKNPGPPASYDYPNPKQVLVANSLVEGKEEYRVSNKLVAFHEKDAVKKAGVWQSEREHAERRASAWDAGYQTAVTKTTLGQAKLAYQRVDLGCIAEFEEGFKARIAEKVAQAAWIEDDYMPLWTRGNLTVALIGYLYHWQVLSFDGNETIEEGVETSLEQAQAKAESFGKEAKKQAKKAQNELLAESGPDAGEDEESEKTAESGGGNDTPGTRTPDSPGQRPLAGEPIAGTGMPDLNQLQAGLSPKAQIEKDPKKWEKMWNSLVGDVKHKWTKCHDKLKNHMTDEQAAGLCNKLKQKFGSQEGTLPDSFRTIGYKQGWGFSHTGYAKKVGSTLSTIVPTSKMSFSYFVSRDGKKVARGEVPICSHPKMAALHAMAFCDVLRNGESKKAHMADFYRKADLTEFQNQQFTKSSDGESLEVEEFAHGGPWAMDDDGEHFKYFSDSLVGVIKPKDSGFKWKLWLDDDRVLKGKADSLEDAQHQCEEAVEHLDQGLSKVSWGYKGLPITNPTDESLVDMGKGEHVPLEPEDYHQFFAKLKTAVDDKAKEYYDSYYGGYGEQLTKDIALKPPAKTASKIDNFWVVTKPTELSELGDICFDTDFQGFILQVKGGLSQGDVHGVYDNQAEAEAEANKLLAGNRTAKSASKVEGDLWAVIEPGPTSEMADCLYSINDALSSYSGQMVVGIFTSKGEAETEAARLIKENDPERYSKMAAKSGDYELTMTGGGYNLVYLSNRVFIEEHFTGKWTCDVNGAHFEMDSCDECVDAVVAHFDKQLEENILDVELYNQGKHASLEKVAVNETKSPPPGDAIFGDSVVAPENPWPPSMHGTVMWVEDASQHGDRQEVAVKWDPMLNDCCSDLQLKHHLKTFIQEVGQMMDKNWGLVSDIQVLIFEKDDCHAIMGFKAAFPSPFVPESRITELRQGESEDSRPSNESHDYKTHRGK